MLHQKVFFYVTEFLLYMKNHMMLRD